MGLGGAIAPSLFYRKNETHLLALQTAKQTGLNVTVLLILKKKTKKKTKKQKKNKKTKKKAYSPKRFQSQTWFST